MNGLDTRIDEHAQLHFLSVYMHMIWTGKIVSLSMLVVVTSFINVNSFAVIEFLQYFSYAGWSGNVVRGISN